MIRYRVLHSYVKYQGIVYNSGDLLPEEFTARDRGRNIYSRRLVPVEIPNEPIAISTPEITKKPPIVTQVVAPITEQPKTKAPAQPHVKPTGTKNTVIKA
jgi:hypothetical protein